MSAAFRLSDIWFVYSKLIVDDLKVEEMILFLCEHPITVSDHGSF